MPHIQGALVHELKDGYGTVQDEKTLLQKAYKAYNSQRAGTQETAAGFGHHLKLLVYQIINLS